MCPYSVNNMRTFNCTSSANKDILFIYTACNPQQVHVPFTRGKLYDRLLSKGNLWKDRLFRVAIIGEIS